MAFKYLKTDTPTEVQVGYPALIPLIKAARAVAAANGEKMGLKVAKEVVEGILRSINIEVITQEQCNLLHDHQNVQNIWLDGVNAVPCEAFSDGLE